MFFSTRPRPSSAEPPPGDTAAPLRPAGRAGFTLVELLVVIGIIALLISILLPALSRAREQGNAIKCLANVRTLAFAFQAYAQNNKGYFPAAARFPSGLIRNEDWIWYQEKPAPGRPTPDLQGSALQPYLGRLTPEMFRCPSDAIQAHVKADPSGTYPYSYAMNQEFECLYVPAGRTRPVTLTQIRNITRKMIVAEEDENSINDGCGAYGDGNIKSTGARDLLAIRHESKKKLPDPRDQQISTHPNGKRRGNAGFLDGHAEFIPRTEAHDKSCLFWNG